MRDLNVVRPVEEVAAEAAMEPVVWQGMDPGAIQWLETTLLSDMKTLVTDRGRIVNYADQCKSELQSMWGVTQRNPNPVEDYNIHHGELKAKRAALEIMCWGLHPDLGSKAQELFNAWWKQLEERVGLEWTGKWS